LLTDVMLGTAHDRSRTPPVGLQGRNLL